MTAAMEEASRGDRVVAEGEPASAARFDLVLQNSEEFPPVEALDLTPWLRRLLHALAPDRDSFTVRFVTDAEMRQLNLRYRQRGTTTDVLSFPGGPSPEGHHLGDVVISVPVAVAQTPPGETVERELRRLLLHGVLHCLGYDHETDDGEMVALEGRLQDQWLGDSQ